MLRDFRQPLRPHRHPHHPHGRTTGQRPYRRSSRAHLHPRTELRSRVAWGWPAATMTYEADQADLLRHEKEIAAHQSFNYALFGAAETALLGCVYIDPPERAGADGEISWWVVDELVGSKVEQALDELVPQWIAADWPFEQPRFLGREISWSDWLALPEHPNA
ncbi:N-acetyltransferase [Streptomyces sp. NBC_00984]|uniref:N-acetyltransferase n=1 Tax=Streptomyces sp. NBC_00984 TaxID=2903700 RepID=UPI00386BFB0F